MEDNSIERNDVMTSDPNSEPPHHERTIPPVGSTSNKEKLFWPLMIGLMVVAAAIFIGFNSFGGDKKESDKIVNQKDEKYDRERITKLEIPKFVPQKPEREPAPVEALPAVPVVAKASVSKRSDNRDAQRRREEMERRWSASPVIYDRLGKGGQTGSAGSYAAATPNEKADRLTELQDRLLNSVSGQININQNKPAEQASLLQTQNRSEPVAKGYAQASLINQDEQRYMLTEGTMINAVLETAIQNNLAGKVRAIIDETIYSFDGQTPLIEKGSTLIGEYQTALKQGQVRLFVIWNRLLTPYGVDAELRSPGTDQLGRAGLSGWVDNHFLERFGSSVMLSLIGAFTAREASRDLTNDQIIAQSVGDNFNKSAEIALENSINIPPTFNKNQGDLIKVFVAQDISFKDAYLLSQQQRRLAAKW